MPNVAAIVRKDKNEHPEKYCANKKCLWQIVTRRGDSPCQNHRLENVVASFGAERFDLTENAANRRRVPTVLPMTESMSSSEQRQALSKLGVPDHAINRAICAPGVEFKPGMLINIKDAITSGANYVHIDPRQLRFPIRLVLPWSHLCSDNFRERASIMIIKGKPTPRKLMDRRYKEARERIQTKARAAMVVDGLAFEPIPKTPLSLVACVWVPDERLHDVCNFSKGVHDALQGIIYANDSQLHDVRSIRMGVDVDSPRAEITIQPY